MSAAASDSIGPSLQQADFHQRALSFPLLQLVAEDNPVLHHQAAQVPLPLSSDDALLLAHMRHCIQPTQLAAASAPWPRAVGMAAPQWGHSRHMFLMCPSGETSDPVKLQAVLNGRYEAIGEENETMQEGCFSVPGKRGTVTRPKKIRVWYDRPTVQETDAHPHSAAESQSAAVAALSSQSAHPSSSSESVPSSSHIGPLELSGWEARVFMHECDHCDGKLYTTAMRPTGEGGAQVQICAAVQECTVEQLAAQRAKEAAERAAMATAIKTLQ
jgi:peptide deformylase